MSATNYSRLVPQNEAEEEEQVIFCIRESLREKTTMPSTSTADHCSLLHEDNEPTQSVYVYLLLILLIVTIMTTLISMKQLLPVQKIMKPLNCFFHCQD